MSYDYYQCPCGTDSYSNQTVCSTADGMAPMFAEVNEGIRWLREQDQWIDAAEIPDFRPTPGTLIFFDWGQDGLVDHVGIVQRLWGMVI